MTRPVLICVAVTVTPGSTAPLSSVTRPPSCAVDSCAEALVVVRRRISAPRHNSGTGRRIRTSFGDFLLDADRRVLFVVRIELVAARDARSEEHTSELQSRLHIVCRLLL